MQRNLLEKVKPKELKIITLGDTGVGKSTLLQNYTRLKFRDYSEWSFDEDYALIEENIDGNYVLFELWDRVGDHKKPALSVSKYQGAACCILLYSINSKSSFEKLKTWKNYVLNVTNTVHFILLGNKINEQREVTKEEAAEWAESQNIVFKELSAEDRNDVKEAFLEVGRIALYDKPALKVSCQKLKRKRRTRKCQQ